MDMIESFDANSKKDDKRPGIGMEFRKSKCTGHFPFDPGYKVMPAREPNEVEVCFVKSTSSGSFSFDPGINEDFGDESEVLDYDMKEDEDIDLVLEIEDFGILNVPQIKELESTLSKNKFDFLLPSTL